MKKLMQKYWKWLVGLVGVSAVFAAGLPSSPSLVQVSIVGTHQEVVCRDELGNTTSVPISAAVYTALKTSPIPQLAPGFDCNQATQGNAYNTKSGELENGNYYDYGNGWQVNEKGVVNTYLKSNGDISTQVNTYLSNLTVVNTSTSSLQ